MQYREILARHLKAGDVVVMVHDNSGKWFGVVRQISSIVVDEMNVIHADSLRGGFMFGRTDKVRISNI